MHLFGPAVPKKHFLQGTTIVIGFSAGGGFDASVRSLASPSNPTVLVENMAGAGSMIAVNYVYNQAKPDGQLSSGNAQREGQTIGHLEHETGLRKNMEPYLGEMLGLLKDGLRNLQRNGSRGADEHHSATRRSPFCFTELLFRCVWISRRRILWRGRNRCPFPERRIGRRRT